MRPRSARHTKTKRTTKARRSKTKHPRTDVPAGGSMATIRLPVHPLYGERVEVIARYGRHALRVEQPDGLRLLPVAWTDLVPRPAALAVRGGRFDWHRRRCASSAPGSRPGSAAAGRLKKLPPSTAMRPS
jgi:hypothetical protein